MRSSPEPGTPPPSQDACEASPAAFFGHPRGLATLFFTEMWERFSYYGMRGILILFMTAGIERGGAGFGDRKAAAIYGLYTALVYLLALPGGWIADKLWGQRRTVFVGGCIIAAGHFSMALPSIPTFYAGLVLIVIGTGLLKPNVSTMVGDLYPEGGADRDAGFSIFYMGINLGALVGPLICGTLGEKVSWHAGFSAAGVGMVLGLIQYRLGARHLGEAGLFRPDGDAAELRRRRARFLRWVGATVGGIVLVAGLASGGVLALSLHEVARFLGGTIVAVALLFFASLFAFGGLDATEKRRLVVMLVFFFLAAAFWSGFEQAGSSMNLFAERLTDRNVLGWKMPASWLQSVNPIFIILLAPVFGWLWLVLGRFNPSTPLKFAYGLLLLAAGFAVISWGAARATEAHPVTPAWLVVTYFLHTCGELCLSPVGLSAFTKLSPRGRVGQMMGVWFIAASLGNLMAGLLAGQIQGLAPALLFRHVALLTGGTGVLALLLSQPLRGWMRGVE